MRWNLVTDGLSAAALAVSLGCTSHDRAPKLSCSEEGTQCDCGVSIHSNGTDTSPFGFFVFGDMHSGATENDLHIVTAVDHMRRIDPSPLAVFSNGDLVDTGSEAQWADHDRLIASAGWVSQPTCESPIGTPRYFASVGDHDIMSPDWSGVWNAHLGNELQQSHDDGVYYSFEVAGALFIVLDSEHVATSGADEIDRQTLWLTSVLDASSASLKFLFFHEPVYPCSSRHEPLAAALPWVDLAERHAANIIFNSHTHVYSRSCAKLQGGCVGDTAGIVYVETGPVGGVVRDVDVSSGTVTGRDASGTARTDSYDCTLGKQLRAKAGMQNDFCHVSVRGCTADVDCYAIDSETPFDSFSVEGCPRDE